MRNRGGHTTVKSDTPRKIGMASKTYMYHSVVMIGCC